MTKKKHIYDTSHVDIVFELEHVKRLIPRAAKLLKGVEFDAIAFRGMSGCLFAAPLALRLNKSMIMVRKPNASHTARVVEGNRAANTYIIVDDFVSTGATVREIIKEITVWAKHDSQKIKCVGVMTAKGVLRTYKSKTKYDGEREEPWVKKYKVSSPEDAITGYEKEFYV